MKAIISEKYGKPDTLKVGEVDKMDIVWSKLSAGQKVNIRSLLVFFY